MSDYQPKGFDRTDPAQGWSDSYPQYADPAYASQLPTYGVGYPSRPPSNPVEQAPRPWAGGQPPGQPPRDRPGGGGENGPPEPPRSPRWLWLLAVTAVLLAVGLVLALMLTNGSERKSATVPPITPRSTLPSTAPPTAAPPTTRPTAPSTSTPPSTVAPPPTGPVSPGAAHTIVYSVTGEGRAISIAYIDTGGVLQTEFNVVLPWSKEVGLTPPASNSASVTVVNIGQQITCSVSVDGAPVRQRTGTILTICSAAG